MSDVKADLNELLKTENLKVYIHFHVDDIKPVKVICLNGDEVGLINYLLNREKVK